MSDAVVTPTDGASVVVDSANKVVPATPAAAAPEEKPAWLDSRLERERSKMLKDLGVESFDDAKKVLEQAKAVEEQKKSDAQKRGELESTLKAEREEKKAMADALSAYAKSQLGALTDAQREAVAMVAGDDPAKQLKTIEALKPTWASAAAAPAAPAQKPKDTAPAPAMPKDGAPAGPPDAKAVHEELLKSNPILAARFALANDLFKDK
jgi:hypothetical protein